MRKNKTALLIKKAAICGILLFVLCQIVLAQIPAWVVKESDFQYTMTFVAKLSAGGKRLIDPNDRVAAFVGNTCRGVSGVTYVASENDYYAFLTVFSNQHGESINFKLYDSSTGQITAVGKQITFVANEHKGNLFQSYSIAEPALNHQAELLSFGFLNIESLFSTIDNQKVKIDIPESNSLTNLKPVFTLSNGAKLLKNRVIQKSGEIVESFSQAVTYEVVSEDESTVNSYTVSVSKATEPTLFYKKDAVCYAAGAIKVVSKHEGALVKITSEGKTIATQQIKNGEALFPDLGRGSYIATMGNEWKLINILLKEN